jgi:hypothetical protein
MQEKIKILFLAPHLSTGGMPSFLLKRIQALIDNEDFELFVVEYADIGGWAYVVQKNEIKRIIKPENSTSTMKLIISKVCRPSIGPKCQKQ